MCFIEDKRLDELERLRVAMEAAAAGQDFKLARHYRDRIALIRGGASAAAAAAADTKGLRRQQPGAMGLGTSQQKMTPPKDWTPPKEARPDDRGQQAATQRLTRAGHGAARERPIRSARDCSNPGRRALGGGGVGRGVDMSGHQPGGSLMRNLTHLLKTSRLLNDRRLVLIGD